MLEKEMAIRYKYTSEKRDIYSCSREFSPITFIRFVVNRKFPFYLNKIVTFWLLYIVSISIYINLLYIRRVLLLIVFYSVFLDDS
jgi:hypothetical protein